MKGFNRTYNLTLFCIVMLTLLFSTAMFAQGGNGNGNNGNGLGNNPPPPVPPPPPGLPIDGAIPLAVAVAVFIGAKKKIQDIQDSE